MHEIVDDFSLVVVENSSPINFIKNTANSINVRQEMCNGPMKDAESVIAVEIVALFACDSIIIGIRFSLFVDAKMAL